MIDILLDGPTEFNMDTYLKSFYFCWVILIVVSILIARATKKIEIALILSFVFMFVSMFFANWYNFNYNTKEPDYRYDKKSGIFTPINSDIGFDESGGKFYYEE